MRPSYAPSSRTSSARRDLETETRLQPARDPSRQSRIGMTSRGGGVMKPGNQVLPPPSRSWAASLAAAALLRRQDVGGRLLEDGQFGAVLGKMPAEQVVGLGGIASDRPLGVLVALDDQALGVLQLGEQ